MGSLSAEGAQEKLQDAIQAKLHEAGIDNDVLAQFVAVMIMNGKTRDQVEEELVGIVGDEMNASEFCGWLFANMQNILQGGPMKVEGGFAAYADESSYSGGFESSHAAPIPVEMNDSRTGPRRLRQNRLLDVALQGAARDSGPTMGMYQTGPVRSRSQQAYSGGSAFGSAQEVGVVTFGEVDDLDGYGVDGSDAQGLLSMGAIRGRPGTPRNQPYPQPVAGAGGKQPMKTPGPPPPSNPVPRQDASALVSEPATTFTVTLNGQVVEERVESKPVRCGFWPTCKKGADCRFWHPVELCPQWPNCPYPDAQCLYIHPARSSIQRQNQQQQQQQQQHQPSQPSRMPRFPSKPFGLAAAAAPIAPSASSGALSSVPTGAPQPGLDDCRFAANCTRADCKFFHPSPAAVVLPRAGLGRVAPGDPKRSARCKFFPVCENPECGFYHPSPAAMAGGGGRPDEMVIELDEEGKVAGGALTGAKSPSNGKIPVPCKFLPFCSKPNCPFEHNPDAVTETNGRRNGKGTADRRFAADQAEERVIPKAEGEDTVMA